MNLPVQHRYHVETVILPVQHRYHGETYINITISLYHGYTLEEISLDFLTATVIPVGVDIRTQRKK